LWTVAPSFVIANVTSPAAAVGSAGSIANSVSEMSIV
jgi:hypothetical protein